MNSRMCPISTVVIHRPLRLVEKFVGAAHKLAGSIEPRERIDAFSDGAFTPPQVWGGCRWEQARQPCECDGRVRLKRRPFDWWNAVRPERPTGRGNSVARDSNGSENGLFEMLDQVARILRDPIVAKHDELGVA